MGWKVVHYFTNVFHVEAKLFALFLTFLQCTGSALNPYRVVVGNGEKKSENGWRIRCRLLFEDSVGLMMESKD